MTTEKQHRFLDLDAVVGELDEDMDGSVKGETDAGNDTGTDAATATGAGTATTMAAAATRSFQIAPGQQVRVRTGPSTSHPVVRKLAGGSWVGIHCQRRGQQITGPYGTTDIWDNIAPGQYVSDAYVHTGSDGPVAPNCTG